MKKIKRICCVMLSFVVFYTANLFVCLLSLLASTKAVLTHNVKMC